MFETIKNSTAIWVILAICTVGSLLYAIITRVKDKKKRQIAYAKRSNYIVSNNNKSIKKLSLSFDGKEIDDLTVTTFAIWNSQDIEIRREDIASECPLTIKSVGNLEILDVEIIQENEKTNKFTIVSSNSKEVVFDFEYLDKKEGIVVQIIHTGDKKDLQVDCKIKGGASVLSVNENSSQIKKSIKKIPKKIFEKVFVAMMIIMCLLYTVMLVFLALETIGVIPKSALSYNSVEEIPMWGKIVTCCISAIELLFIWVMSIQIVRKILNVRVPIEFRDYI